MEFRQTSSFDGSWEKDERIKFGGQGHGGVKYAQMHFLALLAGYLQRESTEFRQTFRIDGSWEKDERITFGGHWVKVTAG